MKHLTGEAPPKKKSGDKYDKILPEIEKVWNLEVATEENDFIHLEIETSNPASWQAYFYAYRSKKKADEGIVRDFSFKKVDKTHFKVWRVIRD